jgi:hypothetical protein
LKNRVKISLELTESIKKRKSEKMMAIRNIGLLETFKQGLKSQASSKQEDRLIMLSERGDGSTVFSARDNCISINS